MPTSDGSILNGIWGAIMVIYSGITGHTYTRIANLETKIDKNKDHADEVFVTKETFEAHMDSIQQANVATARFTDINTRANEKLFDLMNTKKDKD